MKTGLRIFVAGLAMLLLGSLPALAAGADAALAPFKGL
jgi:hypothetical protein